jgi:hypothetical protein
MPATILIGEVVPSGQGPPDGCPLVACNRQGAATNWREVAPPADEAAPLDLLSPRGGLRCADEAGA